MSKDPKVNTSHLSVNDVDFVTAIKKQQKSLEGVVDYNLAGASLVKDKKEQVHANIQSEEQFLKKLGSSEGVDKPTVHLIKTEGDKKGLPGHRRQVDHVYAVVQNPDGSFVHLDPTGRELPQHVQTAISGKGELKRISADGTEVAYNASKEDHPPLQLPGDICAVGLYSLITPAVHNHGKDQIFDPSILEGKDPKEVSKDLYRNFAQDMAKEKGIPLSDAQKAAKHFLDPLQAQFDAWKKGNGPFPFLTFGDDGPGVEGMISTAYGGLLRSALGVYEAESKEQNRYKDHALKKDESNKKENPFFSKEDLEEAKKAAKELKNGGLKEDGVDSKHSGLNNKERGGAAPTR